MRDMLFKGNSSRLELLIEKIQANKENQDVGDQDIEEGLGTEGGSSWSSGASSCPTPNSATELPHAELTFTLGVTEATPYPCQFCDKAFPRLSYLKKHEQTHSEHMPFRCEFCSRLFKHKRSRDRHIKLHTGDKKYRCTQCEAAFSRSDHLKIHMKTHDNQKPFQCTICNRGYNTAAALTSHIQNHKKSMDSETSSSGNTYKCLQCTEIFKKPDDLTSHVASHHQGGSASSTPTRRPRVSPQVGPRLACIYCTRDTFSSMESLQLHVHTMHGSILNGGEQFRKSQMSPVGYQRSFFFSTSPTSSSGTCPLCTMSFPTTQSLQAHINAVHGIRSSADCELFCAQCSVPFPTAALFAEHFLLLHGTHPPISTNITPDQIRPTDLSVVKKQPEERPPSAKKARTSAPPTTPEISRTISQQGGQYEHSGTLLCNQCNAALPDFESFRSHLKSHLDGSALIPIIAPKPNQSTLCPHCGTHFLTHHELAQHFVLHFVSTVTEYGCQSCAKTFPKPEDLQKHLLDVHTQHIYRCAICKEMFDSKVAIQVHFVVQHTNEKKQYRCTACPSAPLVHSEHEFNAHVRAVHGNFLLNSPPPPSVQSPRSLRCIYCHLTFSTELDLQFHLAVHTKQFHCPACPDSFHVEFLLDKHMQSVHGPQVINDEPNEKQKDWEPKGLNVNGLKNHNSSTQHSTAHTASLSTSSNGSSVSDSGKKLDSLQNNNNNNNVGTCDICECGDFASEAELLAHRKLVHHVKISTNTKVSLHCAYCNENCKSRTELENHMKTHCQGAAGAGKHKCNICDEMCHSAIVLAEHKLTHCKVIFGTVCTHCKSSLANEEQFYIHLVQHNSQSNGQQQLVMPVACVICRQTLGTETEARLHARFHLQTETAQCSVCLQGCDKKELQETVCKNCVLRQSNVSARCPQCHLQFETVSAMETHLTCVHKKTYQCNKCQANFESEKDVQAHVASHVASEGSGAYKCRLCMQVLPSLLQLQTHLIEHTFAGCANFTCYLCSAVFTAATGLQAHMMEHGLASRPYDCPRCPRQFFFRAELENHSFIHHDIDTSLAVLQANLYKHGQKLDTDGLEESTSINCRIGSPMDSKNVKASLLNSSVATVEGHDPQSQKGKLCLNEKRDGIPVSEESRIQNQISKITEIKQEYPLQLEEMSDFKPRNQNIKTVDKLPEKGKNEEQTHEAEDGMSTLSVSESNV